MNKLVISLVLMIASQWSIAQSNDPVAIVQRQLDIYNAQDLDAFVEVFSDDVEVYSNLGDPEPAIKGKEELRVRYSKLFENNPENRSTLIGRLVQGNFVFDHEWITGRDNDLSIVAIYEVEEGVIRRCWFAR